MTNREKVLVYTGSFFFLSAFSLTVVLPFIISAASL
jgi:hypothetical protein